MNSILTLENLIILPSLYPIRLRQTCPVELLVTTHNSPNLGDSHLHHNGDDVVEGWCNDKDSKGNDEMTSLQTWNLLKI